MRVNKIDARATQNERSILLHLSQHFFWSGILFTNTLITKNFGRFYFRTDKMFENLFAISDIFRTVFTKNCIKIEEFSHILWICPKINVIQYDIQYSKNSRHPPTPPTIHVTYYPAEPPLYMVLYGCVGVTRLKLQGSTHRCRIIVPRPPCPQCEENHYMAFGIFTQINPVA